MLLRLALGVLMLGQAIGQLVSWDAMPGILAAYGLPLGAATALAVALVAGELVCGVWFVARPRSTALAPVLVYFGVTLVFAGLGGQALLRGLEVVNCGCFGVYLSQRLSLFVLAQDALLLGYGYLLLRARRRARVAPAPVRA
ncbi:MAG: MauE/DoxX family redox-associated membrane protein [Pseudonocardia sp.]